MVLVYVLTVLLVPVLAAVVVAVDSVVVAVVAAGAVSIHCDSCLPDGLSIMTVVDSC